MAKRKRMPTDVNQRAKAVVDFATSDEPENVDDERDPAAVALGKKGASKGGQARAEKLSSDERSEIARKAAAARWGRFKKT